MIRTEVYKNNPHRFMHLCDVESLSIPGTIVSVSGIFKKGQRNNLMVTVIGEPKKVRAMHSLIAQRILDAPSKYAGDRTGPKRRYEKA